MLVDDFEIALLCNTTSFPFPSIKNCLFLTHTCGSISFAQTDAGTSLKVSPSGNFLWGGFSDGTLRVWDLSGTFGVEDDDVVASRQKTDVLVNSKLSQGYGAVACQIHARGVHTDLITTVDISDDAQYVFVGVARGAMELHAVFVGDLERAVHTHKQREREQNGSKNITAKRNILDYIKVYCHSDAKIKGFGACASMKVANPNSSSPSYMLLTGKGIKNIHIWKFTPPKHSTSDELMEEVHGRNRKQSICDSPDDDEDHGIWDQLYDTSTNGNTIVLLGFYRNPQDKLLAVSKSDTQKLRLWDLSFEEDSSLSEAAKDAQRKKRPPYKDVDNSQSTLEIAGGIGVCGGGNMYNEMSIVSLDRPDDPYNHTELALPSAAALSGGDPAQQQQFMGYSSRRQRRGEMKAVVNVATSPRDSSHALLELDDVSVVLGINCVVCNSLCNLLESLCNMLARWVSDNSYEKLNRRMNISFFVIDSVFATGIIGRVQRWKQQLNEGFFGRHSKACYCDP